MKLNEIGIGRGMAAQLSVGNSEFWGSLIFIKKVVYLVFAHCRKLSFLEARFCQVRPVAPPAVAEAADQCQEWRLSFRFCVVFYPVISV